MSTQETEENKDVHAEQQQQKSSSEDDIHIVSPIQDEHLPQACQVLLDSFSTKRCLFCIKISESLPQLQKRYAKMSAAKRNLGAVALLQHENGHEEVVGYVQMATGNMPTYPMNLHSCKKDEMYIEMLGVSSNARGKGVGTLLLEWCQETALNYGTHITRLTLEVLRGNRAIQLYERFGFKIKSVDCCDEACGAFFVCILLGRPFGFCNPSWGSAYMEKHLDRSNPTAAEGMER